MTLSVFLSFVMYTFVTSITPGPNNVMLMASGLHFGFKRSIPHILGIGFGFGFMTTFAGLGIGSLLKTSTILFESVKVLGIIYLLYLAYKIAFADTSHTSSTATTRQPMSFWGGAIFQWVNPKGWIMLMGAITAYTSATSPLYIYPLIGGVYGVIGLPCVGIWAIIGERLQSVMNNATLMRMFNMTMAALLVASIIPSLIQSIRHAIELI